MDWKDIAGDVAKGAPMIGRLLGLILPGAGLVGEVIGGITSMIAGELGVKETPEAVAIAIKDPAALAKLKELELTHAYDLRVMVLQADTARLADINKTIRAEAGSEDKYVRRMRPTFGYSMCLNMQIFFFAILWTVWTNPDKAPAIIRAMGDGMSVTLPTGLAVLGIYLKKRSDDKNTAAGHAPPVGLLGQAMKMIGKG